MLLTTSYFDKQKKISTLEAEVQALASAVAQGKQREAAAADTYHSQLQALGDKLSATLIAKQTTEEALQEGEAKRSAAEELAAARGQRVDELDAEVLRLDDVVRSKDKTIDELKSHWCYKLQQCIS